MDCMRIECDCGGAVRLWTTSDVLSDMRLHWWALMVVVRRLNHKVPARVVSLGDWPKRI